MKRFLLSILLMLLPLMVLHAERTFEAGIRGGIAHWTGASAYIGAIPNAHAGVQVSFSWFAPRVIGIRAGVTADMHRAGWGRTGYEDSYSMIDADNQTMQINYSIGSLTEIYTNWTAGIPVQLAFHRKNWAIFIGPKVVFPLKTTWYEEAKDASLSIYYPVYDNHIYESIPLAASRSFSMNGSGPAAMRRVQWWLSAELNYSLPLHTTRRHISGLSIGIYFDYCFSKTSNTSDMSSSLILLSDTRYGFPLTRTMSSVMATEYHGRPLIIDYALFDVGIKISYYISSNKSVTGRKSFCHCE